MDNTENSISTVNGLIRGVHRHLETMTMFDGKRSIQSQRDAHDDEIVMETGNEWLGMLQVASLGTDILCEADNSMEGKILKVHDDV